MTPPWLNREEYPFESRFLDLEMGRLHYVDEGAGEPIVMVHGNPTWSFLYRHLIRGLADGNRCVAADHIGFGLSDKPAGWSYRPEDHAANLARLIEHLDLRDITLVVQDWGGPIGLDYAVRQPGKVRRLVIMNTWMWSVRGNAHFERFSGLMGGALGRFLIRRLNLFARVVMKQAYGDKARLTKEIHRHYLAPLATPQDRLGCSIFPREIIASSTWLEELWSRRAGLKGKPVLLLWGMQDIAFRKEELDRWQELFPEAETISFPATGHYVQEEQGAVLCAPIRAFLEQG